MVSAADSRLLRSSFLQGPMHGTPVCEATALAANVTAESSPSSSTWLKFGIEGGMPSASMPASAAALATVRQVLAAALPATPMMLQAWVTSRIVLTTVAFRSL